MIDLIPQTRRPDITFIRDGRILLAAKLVRALAISPGDSINISRLNGEFLIHASPNSLSIGRHEAMCRPTKKNSNNFCANSTRLARAILDAAGIPANRAAFPVGEAFTLNNKTYIPIITRKPIWTN